MSRSGVRVCFQVYDTFSRFYLASFLSDNAAIEFARRAQTGSVPRYQVERSLIISGRAV